VFLRRDAGAFDEVEDGDGDVAIEPAGDARGLEVAAAFLGMLREVLGRVAAHEREPEGPAGLADDGRPDQDALEEEARERRDAVEDADEGEDVDPGDVVADDEVVAVAPQAVDSLDVPLRREREVEDEIAPLHEPLGEPGQRAIDPVPQLPERQQLHYPADEDGRAPEDQVEDQQGDDEEGAEHARQFTLGLRGKVMMLPPLEDDPRFSEALRFFRDGDWLEASDLFEELFFEAVRDEVPLVRVLLQISTGMHHLSRG